MRQLLYIPSGKYFRFMDGEVEPIELYLERCLKEKRGWETSYEIIIKAVCELRYNKNRYKAAEIDVTKSILPSEFEVVETNEEKPC